jgi:hypothetical protein
MPSVYKIHPAIGIARILFAAQKMSDNLTLRVNRDNLTGPLSSTPSNALVSARNLGDGHRQRATDSA